MTIARIFRCAGCGGTFQANNTEAERDAEAAALYAGTPDEAMDSVCDACHLQTLEVIKADPGRVEADRAQALYAKAIRK